MEAVAESDRKHGIPRVSTRPMQPACCVENERADAGGRDGQACLARPNSRSRRERGQLQLLFPVQFNIASRIIGYHTQQWSPLGYNNM